MSFLSVAKAKEFFVFHFQHNKKKLALLIFALVLIFIVLMGVLLWRLYNATSNVLVVDTYEEKLYADFTAPQESNRIDILILGVRGKDDEIEASILTDTIILASFDKQTKNTSMISIPRDLYVRMPTQSQDEQERFAKINNAYQIGELRDGQGLNYAREVVQYISGVHIDHTLVVNFQAFTSIIDSINGVTINRATPFSEPCQWQGEGGRNESKYWKSYEQEPELHCSSEARIVSPYWEFYIPAGQQSLSSEDALYYIRSRFSSNDFQRARRQQEVLNAIRQKVLSLGTLANPVKIIDLTNELKNVEKIRTDMELDDMRYLLEIAKNNTHSLTDSAVLEPKPDGVLQETYDESGRYIIVPRDESWGEVRLFFQDILNTSSE